jgi:hypothetical protein
MEALGGFMGTMTCDGERWTQEQVDAVERAKEQQRLKEKEQQANQQRQANSHNRQAENVQ